MQEKEYGPDQIVEAGFDLTNFGSPDNFRTVLEQSGIPTKGNPTRGVGFEWECERGMFVTANNPITGEHYGREREPEKGYASYIGITGELEWVALVTFLIEREAVSIKGRSYRSRDYI